MRKNRFLYQLDFGSVTRIQQSAESARKCAQRKNYFQERSNSEDGGITDVSHGDYAEWDVEADNVRIQDYEDDN